jgi:tRNA dimethylallyltransferase
MKPLIVILGPTAMGKSKLALQLAQELGGELISADSRQVYRYMDIGTAKPTPEERALIPHHLIDVVNPDESFSLALFQELAYQALEDIHHRGKLAILVGGSGLYIWSLIEGWRPPPVPPSPELRHALEARAQTEGYERLYEELKALDPAAAEGINPRNTRRIIRALEVCQYGGKPFSQLQEKRPASLQTLIIGLATERGELYRRIDSRVDSMIKRGLVDEVESLVARGYSLDLSSMSAVGYKQIGLFLQGKLALSQAIQRIKYDTHRLARHQYSWFRLSDERIHWFDIKEEFEGEVKELILRWQ